MKISVIIPVYNGEAFLPAAADSVLNQTERDFELILVNDGSQDNSGALCRAYAEKDSRVKVIDKKQNEYVGAARNAGLALAKGEYVYFLDADDRLSSPDVFARVKGKMEEGISLLTSRARATSDGKKRLGALKTAEDGFLFSPYLGQSFYKRECLQTPFSAERKTAEDCEWLFYNLQNMETVAFFDFSFYIYTVNRGGSLTNAMRPEYIRPTIATWQTLYRAENNFADRAKIKRYCADALIEHSIYAGLAGMEEEVAGCLPYLKESKAGKFLPLRHLIGMKGVLFLINVKMKRKLYREEK